MAAPFKQTSVNASLNNTVSIPSITQRNIALGNVSLAVLSTLYSLAIWDVEKNEILKGSDGVSFLDAAPDGGKAIRTSAEFFFRIPPKTHEMAEPWTTRIIATQGGGKYVESHGSIIKEVKVTGTTGLRPTKKRAIDIPLLESIPLVNDALSLANDAIGVVNDIKGIFAANESNVLDSNDERIGYDDIIMLRNLFRKFSDLKVTNDAGKYLLLWRNAKDADYWVVEPSDFRLTQDSNSPLTYNYNITLSTLARFDVTFNRAKDPRDLINDGRKLFQKVNEAGQLIGKSLNVLNTQVTRLEGLGIATTNTLLVPYRDVLRGAASLKRTGNRFGDNFKTNIRKLTDDIDKNLAYLQGTTGVNGQRIASPAVRTGVSAQALGGDGFGIVGPQDPAVRSMRRTQVALARLSELVASQEDPDDNAARQNAAVAAFNKAGISRLSRTAPLTGGSATFLGNEPLPNNVASAVVHFGDTIRSLAARLLGNRARWQVLVVLNQLRAPYIAFQRSQGVLQPGDSILYPVTSFDASDSLVVGNTDEAERDKAFGEFSAQERAYGRDLRLETRALPGGGEFADLAVNTDNDISSISGVENVKQAMLIKFSTVQGELTVHPLFGATFPVGSKMTKVAFNEFRIQTMATIVSDKRVAEVPSLTFQSSGDILAINARIRLKDTNSVINTQFAVRV